MTDGVFFRRSDYAIRFHTDEVCPYLPSDPAAVRSTFRAAVESPYDECEICSDGDGDA